MWRFIACNQCVQHRMAGMAPPGPPYCTQQTGGPTRGVTLRPIQAAKPISRSFAPVKRLARRRDYPRPGHCVQDATVQFYADGPSDPIGSIMRMLEIDLAVPDHTTLSRWACGLPVPERARIGTGDLHLIVDSTGLKLRGAGEWLFEKHGTAKRRAWRKLHIGLDTNSGEIVAFDL